MSDAPCLTVVIPTHDRPDLLREAVESALAACPAHTEVLVVDDRSRVPAETVLAGLMTDERLRVMPSPGPAGAAGARNAGVAAARAPLVLFLDDDDWLLPGYPARILALDPASRFGFCATVTESSRIPGRSRYKTGPLDARIPLRHRLVGFGCGFWISRELYLALGGCDPAQRVDEDTEFCCRLAAGGMMPFYDATPGIRVRRSPSHADRLTRSTAPAEVVACYRRTWERHQSNFGPWSEARWHLATRLIRRAIREGRPQDAMDSLARVTPRSFRVALWAVYHAKRLRHAPLPRSGARGDA